VSSTKQIKCSALEGLTVRLVDGTMVEFTEGPEEDWEGEGGAPVREPRRPKPAPPSLEAEAEEEDLEKCLT